MIELAALGQVFLAGVFILSGGMKLADAPGSRQALLAFGVPEWLAAPFGRVVPVAEITVAATLLCFATAWFGAAAGAALLSVFTVAIAYNLARGRRPECNCFGSLGAARIGPLTLARNAVFLAIAVFVVRVRPIDSGWGLDAWVSVVIAVGVAVLVATARVLFPNRPGLPIDAPAPDFVAEDLGGRRTSLAELAADGLPMLLIFASPGCSACERMLPSVGKWQRDLADTLRIVLTHESDASRAYRVSGTPAAVLIGRDLRIGSRPAIGEDAIRDLIGRTTGSSAAVREQVIAARPGDPAPPLRLLDADGQLVDLAQYRGRATAVLFFSPDCPHARQLLGALETWETDPPSGAPDLLVISRGSWEANRDLGFRASLVLDPSLEVAAAFGATSTPSAVLVDADGVIASGVARGTRAVQALLNVPFEHRAPSVNPVAR